MKKANTDKIIEHLRNKKNITIVSVEPTHGGINSAVLKVTDSQKNKYALKIYPRPGKYDKRDRRKTEENFYEHLAKQNIKNSAKMVYTDQRLNFSVITWLNGQRIKKLNRQYIAQIAKFIDALNLASEDRVELPIASDALTSLHDFTKSVEGRLRSIKHRRPETIIEHEIERWVSSSLEPFIIHELQQLAKKETEIYWHDSELCKCVSPSDVGIHNAVVKDRKLYFFDFEYAGLDDISKLVADWVLQPNHPFSGEDEQYLIDRIVRGSCFTSTKWVERYKSMKTINAAKWVLIMLRGYAEGSISEMQWRKIQDYSTLHHVGC